MSQIARVRIRNLRVRKYRKTFCLRFFIFTRMSTKYKAASTEDAYFITCSSKSPDFETTKL